MKLSSKSVYAIKLFVDLAEHKDKGFTSVNDISTRKEKSKKYLEQVIALFKPTGLLLQARGKQGGYALAKKPVDIKISDILSVTEDVFGKSLTGYGPLDLLAGDLDRAVNSCLDNVTLEDLLRRQLEEYSNSYMI